MKVNYVYVYGRMSYFNNFENTVSAKKFQKFTITLEILEQIKNKQATTRKGTTMQYEIFSKY